MLDKLPARDYATHVHAYLLDDETEDRLVYMDLDAVVHDPETLEFTVYDSKFGPKAGPTPNQALLEQFSRYGEVTIEFLNSQFASEDAIVTRIVFVKTG